MHCTVLFESYILSPESTPNINAFLGMNIVPKAFVNNKIIFNEYRLIFLQSLRKCMMFLAGKKLDPNSLNDVLYSTFCEVFPECLDAGCSGVHNHIDDCIDDTIIDDLFSAVNKDIDFNTF